MQINKQDLDNFKTLRMILDKSKLELEGAAVKAVASAFIWAESFQQKMAVSLETKPPKEVKEAVKKL